MSIPRLRGRVGQGDDGKYYFELSMWNFEGTERVGEPFGTFGPWKNENEAKKEMRKAVEIACKAIKGPNGEAPNGFVDFKNGGEFRKFASEEQ
jgi:hypothetical protein